ncbi:hypothetical protein RHGRI_005781 [Rhododendron griersonianum]|uniref:Uncharacterized protein n=1 Tax=Rhododendron griersonianum TaxID=479676 RepID=A0AAV6LDF6_9ERIC|nr:hypothetical protein RHGRI_005781 [Rhododendron griersonianum]
MFSHQIAIIALTTFDGGKSRYDFGSWRSLHKSTSSASGVGGWACAFELSRWQLEFHGVDEWYGEAFLEVIYPSAASGLS